MEPSLVVIGLNFRTAAIEVRERFWMDELQRSQALHLLARTDGIEEVAILANCERTEFILWTNDFSAAGNSVLQFLTRGYGLRLCEWTHFYRLLGEAALLHVFRTAAGLDSMQAGEPEIVNQIKAAWTRAQHEGTAGRFLNRIFEKALETGQRAATETALNDSARWLSCSVVELAQQTCGPLQDRDILILGAGNMGHQLARCLVRNGATSIQVANRTYPRAQELARSVGGEAVGFEERLSAMLHADLVICSIACPHVIVTREDAERLNRDRGGRPLFFIDAGVPRNVDPEVRQVPGTFLYDMEDWEKLAERRRGERQLAAAHAELIVAGEAAQFDKALTSEPVAPTIMALRERLDEFERQELESYAREFGPLSALQREAFQVFGNRIVHRIAGSLASELKQTPGTVEQDRLATALRRLFHLEHAELTAPR